MEQYELDAILDELDTAGGSGTWYISLYIRPDKSLNTVRNRMKQEVSEAESIKSDDTKERVQDSLKKINRVLSDYSQTPDNGLIVFASPSSVHVLDELPFECPENRYHCGKEFLTKPLYGGIDADNEYGLIVVERGRAAIGVLSGGRLVDVTEKESQVMGKTKAGGQSAQRFARLREKQLHEFFLDVAETADNLFNRRGASDVVVGGTLDTAKSFADEYTRHDWSLLGTYSVDHGDEQGLEELVERASERILEAEEARVREDVEAFLSGVRDGSSAYGRDEVRKKLERGAVDTILLSTNLDVDEIQEFSALAEEYGGDATIVEPTFEEAEMFENLSGGYGAILRW